MMSIVNDGLPKTLIRALPYGTVWVDECSPFVVPGVANILGTNGTSIGLGFFLKATIMARLTLLRATR